MYYTKAGGARKGHVPVADARVSKLEGVPGHKHVFSVCTAGGVTLALEAASEEDCARWMAALQLASASTVVLQASLHKYHRWRKVRTTPYTYACGAMWCCCCYIVALCGEVDGRVAALTAAACVTDLESTLFHFVHHAVTVVQAPGRQASR